MRGSYYRGMTKTAKLSSKSQITIPSWARAAVGIEPGARLSIRVVDGAILIEPVLDSVQRLKGSLRGVYGDPDRYVEEIRREWDRETR